MPTDRLQKALVRELDALEESGSRKGAETVFTGVVAAEGARGPRYRVAGEGGRSFLRMNSNGYLGWALHPEVIAAEETAARELGTGPQAVRFISGTWAPHTALESRLAAFHGRPAALIWSSAYAAVMGVLPPLTTPRTAILSDALNHNSIIQATRLARPAQLHVVPHVEPESLEEALGKACGECERALIVTDGVFSMRGDHAPLERITEIAQRWDDRFPENVVTIVDDSHSVGALGTTGRGTEEATGARADLLVATLGKAFGVNGGYAVGPAPVIELLREKSPFYVYSNPITAAEAAAATRAIELTDGEEGRRRLAHLRGVTARFRDGLRELGWETLPGEHPVVPLLVRDTGRTRELVAHLRSRGVLATGLAHPVVPRGEEEIRFQLSAEHTEADVDEALEALRAFRGLPAAPAEAPVGTGHSPAARGASLGHRAAYIAAGTLALLLLLARAACA